MEGAPHGGFDVTGVWNGFPASDGAKALKPLLSIPGTTVLSNTFAKRTSYWEAWLAGIGSGRDSRAPQRREYIQSAFMSKPLPKETWEAVFAGQFKVGSV